MVNEKRGPRLQALTFSVKEQPAVGQKESPL